MELRPYQKEAVAETLDHIMCGHNPVNIMATGTGKSLVMAEVAREMSDTGRPTLVVTHDTRLVLQNAVTYRNHTGEAPGVICATLNAKQLGRNVTFGSIASVANLADQINPAIVMIDEAHRVPHLTGDVSQYELLFKQWPEARRVAFTATPWRLDNGIIYGTKNTWFDCVSYEYKVARGVADGYLCPLVGVEAPEQLDVKTVSVDSDYRQNEVAELQSEEWLRGVAQSVGRLAAKRRHIGVYCPNVESARRAATVFNEHLPGGVGVLHSSMSPDDQAEVMAAFKSGEIRFLCSVDMITTGFDFPAMDCIVCLRPTISSSLWVQIQGRLTRLHIDKKNGLVLDFVGNLLRLGGVGMYDTYIRSISMEEVEAVPVEPYRKPTRAVYPGTTGLPVIDPMTGAEATTGSLVPVTVHKVSSVALQTRGRAYPTLLVTYICTTDTGARLDASSFIDTERPNEQTLKFFGDRRVALQLPAPAQNASWVLKNAYQPHRAVITKSGRYWNVVREEFSYDE